MIAGLIGVPTGTFVAQKLRYKYPRIDAHVCAVGLLVSSPLIFLSCVSARYSATTCFALVFFAMFFLNLNWSLVADIVLVRIEYLYIFRVLIISKEIVDKHDYWLLSLNALKSTKCLTKRHVLTVCFIFLLQLQFIYVISSLITIQDKLIFFLLAYWN